LKETIIVSDVEIINNQTFFASELKRVLRNDNLKKICEFQFWDLPSILIPKGVRLIDATSFFGCERWIYMLFRLGCRQFCHFFVITTVCIGRTDVGRWTLDVGRCRSPSDPFQENKSRASGIPHPGIYEKRAIISGRCLKTFVYPRMVLTRPDSQFVELLRVFKAPHRFRDQISSPYFRKFLQVYHTTVTAFWEMGMARSMWSMQYHCPAATKAIWGSHPRAAMAAIVGQCTTV
jgi:hypothetical protein